MTGARRRALVFYSRVGGGHLSAARALSTELRAVELSTRLVDVYLECGRFPVTWFPAAYAQLVRHHPGLWSMIYRGSNTHLDPKRILRPFLNQGLRRLMASERPDVVISVLPAINGLLAQASAQQARLEVVVTDWRSVHRFWVADGVDAYAVPSESARDDCVRFGATRTAIQVSGIPVRREFADAGASATHAASDTFTILAMVGAEGSPRALRSIAQLAMLGIDAQLVVVCGHDRELRERIQRLPSRLPLVVHGYVDNIAELMRSADILVTKAGGVTLAEAFCCRVPVVVHDLLPGQEAGNLEYVLGQKAVAYTPNARALARTIVDLYDDPERRAMLVEQGQRLARPDAAQRIASNVLRRLNV